MLFFYCGKSRNDHQVSSGQNPVSSGFIDYSVLREWHKGFEHCSRVCSRKKSMTGFPKTKLLRKAVDWKFNDSKCCYPDVKCLWYYGNLSSYPINWLGFIILFLGVEIIWDLLFTDFFRHSMSPTLLQERLLWHGTSWECVPNIVCLCLQWDSNNDDAFSF